MDNEREYYIAGGEDLQKAMEFIEHRKTAIAEMQNLAIELGGRSSASNGLTMGGVIFKDNEYPLGWIRKGYTNDNEAFYMPNRSTKPGKETAKRIRDIIIPDVRQFHRLFDSGGGVNFGPGRSGYGRGDRILYMTWELIGDQLLLSVPIGSSYVPNGSRKLKMSEYWTMKEAKEEYENEVTENGT